MLRFPLRFLLSAIALASAACTHTPSLTRGPYLQQATEGSVVVVWRTVGPTTPRLLFGSSPDALNAEVAGETITLRVSADVQAATTLPRLYKEPPEETPEREADHDPSTPPNTYQYEAHVSGLRPGTKYFYAVYDGDRRLAGADEDHSFVSHPPRNSEPDMRIWVVGDSGTGGADQRRVHDAMRAYVTETGRPVDHYLHVGDMAYSDGTDREFQEHFFEPYQVTLRNTVCWPTMGNHEGHTSRGISGVGPYYDAYVVPVRAEAGGVPSGTEAYYSFDIAGVHFVCLDSHDLDRSPNAAMAQWLRADLEQAKAKWLIAFWHHPPYSMGSHDSDRETALIEMRENFMPILESAGVDLTLTGHSHIYERSMLMDGAYATPTTAEGVILDDGDGDPAGDGPYRKSEGLQPNEGSVSIVAGHGGTGLSRSGTMPVMRQILLEHGSVLLDIQGDTLKGIMLNKDGETRDLFSIVKQGKVTPERVANPWQPVHDPALLTEFMLEFANLDAGTMPEGWRVVRGDPVGVSVGRETGGLRNVLQAEAKEEAVVVLYEPWRMEAFEIGAEFRLAAEDGKGAGFVFDHVDARNHGRVYLDAAAGALRVSRIVDGVETIIEERRVAVPLGEWLQLEIEADERRIEVQYEVGEQEVEFETSLGVVPARSSVGFQIPANSSAEFRMIEVQDEGERP